MVEITSIIGAIVAVVAVLVSIFSLRNQHKQTRLMATQVDKQIEIKITRDLDAAADASDSAPRSAIDLKLRNYLTNRLSKVRSDMREEFDRRFAEIAHKDVAVEAIRLLSAEQDTMAKFEASSDRVEMLAQDLQTLKRAMDDLRYGAGNQEMVRAQIRGIAEQLLRMTSQEHLVQPTDSSATLEGGHQGATPSADSKYQ